MKTLTFILTLLCLMFSIQAGDCQSPLQEPTFTFDVKPMWAKLDLDFKDQFKLSASRGLVEFDFGVTLAPFRLKYCLTTGMRPGGDQIIPTDIVRIGGVEFGEKRTTKPPVSPFSKGGQNQKPLDIDWSMGASHRFELTKFIDAAVQPILVGELCDVRINAAEGSTGRDAGRYRTATETLRPFVWAAGAQYANESRYGLLIATLAASDKYSFAEISYFYDVTDWLALLVGWQHKTVSVNDVKLWQNAWFLGGNLVW